MRISDTSVDTCRETLHASCRVALAGFVHDLGKLAERARLDAIKEEIESNKHLYCPFHKERGYFSHVHAAYTGIAIDRLEAYLPDLAGQSLTPFADWKTPNADDSLINAAAKHHRPETFLQWIIATADRVASGFEREQFEEYNQAQEDNHYRSRLLPLFEQIRLDGTRKPDGQLAWRYPLKPLSVAGLFPDTAASCVPETDKAAQSEYQALWLVLESGIKAIPAAHRASLDLWLDHFDSLWQTVAQAIPSATAFGARPDVSLYDHSKTTAALATALWRYHHDREDDIDEARANMASRSDWSEEKFLLIQGDFFGIQSFIFSEGSATNKKAAKLLRGRSFYVSLLTECASLRILQSLGLPSTSQITNAAGKFLIVAPNTPEVIQRLKVLQSEFNHWFLNQSYGQSGLGLAWVSASCNDFRSGEGKNSPFRALISRLFEQLDIAKFQRYDLCGDNPAAPVFTHYLESFKQEMGVCAIDGKQPATLQLNATTFISPLADDQIKIGGWLASPSKQRLLIARQSLHGSLNQTIFGLHVNFTGPEEASGKFGELARQGQLLRVFDISLPEADKNAALFHGYARRFINAYVPVWGEQDDWESEKYPSSLVEDAELTLSALKTFEHIASDDRRHTRDGTGNHQWTGIRALQTLKGDVDNLGAIFEAGLAAPTFAKMASLSRQMNNYFAIWLPWQCANDPKYRNMYTVFAGGDDFFLIGPWQTTLHLAAHMRKQFAAYVAQNEQIHFSVGLLQTKPGLPLRYLADESEEALEQSKAVDGKDAVTVFHQSMNWAEYWQLLAYGQRLTELKEEYQLSTGLIYSMLELCDMAGRADREPQAARWRSYLSYRIARYVADKLAKQADESAVQYDQRKQRIAKQLITELAGAIQHWKARYKLALTIHLYQVRDQ